MYNDNERNHDYRRKKKKKIESTGVPAAAEANKAIVVPGSAPRFSGDLRITARSWSSNISTFSFFRISCHLGPVCA